MTDIIDASHAAANDLTMPEGWLRLIEIEDAIANIRTQIATADLARQRGRPIEPDWLHRARTALRHLSRERAELVAHRGGRRRRERMKDAIIAVLRDRHDAAAWSGVLIEARSWLARDEAS